MRLGDKITSWVLNLVKVPEIITYYLTLPNITYILLAKIVSIMLLLYWVSENNYDAI